MTLLVGEDQVKFEVHKQLLCKTSGFFKACLGKHFVEGPSNQIELPEDKPAPVRLYIEWIYTHKIVFRDLTAAGVVELYQFVDRVSSPKYHNHFMDAVRDYCIQHCTSPSATILYQLYDIGLGSTPLAMYVGECVVYEWMPSPNVWKAGLEGQKNVKEEQLKAMAAIPELMEDTIKAILEFRLGPWDKPWEYKGCRYHLHEEGEVSAIMKEPSVFGQRAKACWEM